MAVSCPQKITFIYLMCPVVQPRQAIRHATPEHQSRLLMLNIEQVLGASERKFLGGQQTLT